MVFEENLRSLGMLDRTDLIEIIRSTEFDEKLDLMAGNLYNLHVGIDEESIDAGWRLLSVQSLDVMSVESEPSFMAYVRTRIVVSFSVSVPAEICRRYEEFEHLRDLIDDDEPVSFTEDGAALDVLFSFGHPRKDGSRNIELHCIEGAATSVHFSEFDPVSGRFGGDWIRERSKIH